MKAVLLIPLLVVTLIAAPPLARHASAQDTEAETTARLVLIALRVLAYDRSLSTRASGAELTVLIVNAPTKEGRADRDRWRAAFALMPNVKAGGRRVRATTFEVGGQQGFDAAVARLHPALVIVGSGLAKELGSLTAVTRTRSALSCSLREADVRAGVGFGVVPGEKTHQIVINLEAARAEGARFSAGLLQLARLVDEEGR